MQLVNTSADRTAYSEDECAVRVLLGEAANQSEIGMLAVAAVICNRLTKRTGFGISLMDILRPSQFNGFDAHTLRASPVYAEAYDAWELAYVKRADPTRGALYYARPSLSQATWARRLSNAIALQIGDQFFTDNVFGVPFHPGVIIDKDASVSAFLP